MLHWSPGARGRWSRELDAVDAVIDVSGAPFVTRWRGDYYTREVFGSRLRAIRALVDAVEAARVRPRTFISTSSLGCYGFRRQDQVLTESSASDSGPLSQDVVRLETLALDAADLGPRVVLARPGFVLAPDGGAFGQLLPTFARGAGRVVAPGNQWCSWIHIEDAVALIIRALDDDRVRGPLNLTSPAPVRNEEFAQALARAVARRLRPPVPGRLVHLKFGKAAITVTHGQRVLPGRALELGYGFRYPEINAALADLVATVRRGIGACDRGSKGERSHTRAG